MPSEHVYVPIRPIHEARAGEPTHIMVGVNRNDLTKKVFISAYPSTRTSKGMDIIAITNGLNVDIEPMPRLNRKRLDILRSAMRNEIHFQNGRAWDLVTRLCHNRGYIPSVAETSAAAV